MLLEYRRGDLEELTKGRSRQIYRHGDDNVHQCLAHRRHLAIIGLLRRFGGFGGVVCFGERCFEHGHNTSEGLIKFLFRRDAEVDVNTLQYWATVLWKCLGVDVEQDGE